MSDTGRGIASPLCATGVLTLDPFLQALPSNTRLPVAVQELHSAVGLYAGQCEIERGKGRLIAMALRLGRFPQSGSDVPVRVRIGRAGQHWIWDRDFVGHKTRSRLTYDHRSGCVQEQLGAIKLWLKPVWSRDGLKIEIHRLTVFGLPLPNFLLPRSSTSEWQDDQGQFRFDVAAEAPGLGLLIRYRGWLTPTHDASDGA